MPHSYTQALQDPHWNVSIQAEYSALIKNRTWVLVPRPPEVNVVRSIWLFKRKLLVGDSLDRYKYQLVANNKSQQPGIDFLVTFSPVVKPSTIRTVLSLCISRSCPIHQLDVQNAALHGFIQETVFMYQPPEFINP